MRLRQIIDAFRRGSNAWALCLASVSASALADGLCRQSWCWQSPLPLGTTLLGVWGSSPDDVWVTGDAGTLLHWDGNTWVSFEGAANLDGFLNVWGSGPNDVWAVGYGKSNPPLGRRQLATLFQRSQTP